MKLIIPIIGGLLFFLLNCLFPWAQLLFPYLEYSDDKGTMKWWASEVKESGDSSTSSISYDSVESAHQDILWTVLHYWQWLLLLGGLVSVALVIIPPLMEIQEKETLVPLNHLGLIIGLVVSGIEWLLFILLRILEDWDIKPTPNTNLLYLNIGGFILLSLAANPSFIVSKIDKIPIIFDIIRRGIMVIVFFFLVINLTFFLFHIIPDDSSIVMIANPDHPIREELNVDEIKEEWGLNKSLWDQYLIFIEHFIAGDFGQSFNFVTREGSREVSEVISGDRLENTRNLLFASIILAFMFVFVIGKISDSIGEVSAPVDPKSNYLKSIIDRIPHFLPLIAYSAPVFWVGILFLFYRSPPFPIGGTTEPGTPSKDVDYNTWNQDYWNHMLGPLIVLTIFIMGWFYVNREQVLNELVEDYAVISGANDLDKRRIQFIQSKKNGILPILAVFAKGIPYFIMAIILIETTFTWSGLGLLVVQALNYQDYPVLQALFYNFLILVILSYCVYHILFTVHNVIQGLDMSDFRSQDRPNNSSWIIFRKALFVLISIAFVVIFISSILTIKIKDYQILLEIIFPVLIVIILLYCVGTIVFAIYDLSQDVFKSDEPKPESQVSSNSSFWIVLRESPFLLIGTLLITFFIIVAIFAPVIAPYDPSEPFVGATNEEPSSDFLFGTDTHGRDIFSQHIWSFQTVLIISSSAAIIAVIIGAISGFMWGISFRLGRIHYLIDTFMVGITDFFMQIPMMLFILVVMLFNERNNELLIILMGLLLWPRIARVIRAETISYLQQTSIEIPRLVFRISSITISVIISAILVEAGISFLGWGDPDAWTFGRILNNAQTNAALMIGDHWWFVPPGIFILLILLGFSLLRSSFSEIESKLQRRQPSDNYQREPSLFPPAE